jgi:hypothetical protein
LHSDGWDTYLGGIVVLERLRREEEGIKEERRRAEKRIDIVLSRIV